MEKMKTKQKKTKVIKEKVDECTPYYAMPEIKAMESKKKNKKPLFDPSCSLL